MAQVPKVLEQQPSASSRVQPANPTAENLGLKIVAWAVVSVFVARKTERRGALKLVSAQVVVPEIGELVRRVLPLPGPRMRETVAWTEGSHFVA